MKIESMMVEKTIQAAKALYGQEINSDMVQLQKTKKEFQGHYTLVVFPFLKAFLSIWSACTVQLP